MTSSRSLQIPSINQRSEEQITNPIGRIVSIHISTQPLVELRAPIHRPSRRPRDDRRHAVNRHGPHINQHPRHVDERREQEDRLPPQEVGEHHPRHLLHEVS